MTYLITFSCYGLHVPGDGRGSYDHVRNGNRRFIPPNPGLESYRRKLMTQAPYSLDTPHHRKIVADAIVEVSQHRRWGLIALHVRTTHLHAIVETNADPKKVINDWKAYATRALRAGGFAAMNTSVWAARGNSTPLRDGVEDAIRYVLDGQGDAMESRYVGLGR